jgi:hypothetical protein
MLEMSKILEVSRQALDKKLQRQPGREPKPQPKPVAKPSGATDQSMVEYRKTQNHMLALLLLHPGLRPEASLLRLEMLPDEAARQLFVYLAEHPDFRSDDLEGAAAQDGLSDALWQSIVDYARILQLHHEELYGSVESVELQYEVTRLQARLIEQFIKHQKQSLTAKLGTADEETTRQVLTKVKELDALLLSSQKQTRNRVQGDFA